MSDRLQEKKLIKAAQHLFLYFSGKIDIERLNTSFAYLFENIERQSNQYYQTGENSVDSRFRGLLDAIQVDNLMSDWASVFHSSEEPTVSQAHLFLQQAFNSIESDQEYFSYLNIAAQASCIKNSWSDYKVFRPHKKAGWTLHLTLKGSGHYDCIRTTIETSPGDILLFSPTAYIHKQRSESCEEWAYSFVKFQPDDRAVDLLNWPEVASGIYRIKTGNKRELASVESLINFLTEQGWAPEESEIRIRGALVEALLQRCQQIIKDNGYQQTDPRVQAAAQFIETNLYSDLCVDKIAAASCLSASALSKLFRKYYGISVMQWREEKRIAAACHKLAKTNKQIAQIADHLGYANQMYFSRCFRKQMNMSPSSYRNLYSKIQAQ